MKIIVKVDIELDLKEEIKLEGNLAYARAIESHLQLNLIEKITEFVDVDINKEFDSEYIEKIESDATVRFEK